MDEPQPSGVYRGATRDEAERAYHLDARTRAEAGFAPASEEWTAALGQHVLSVRYRYEPEAARATLTQLDQIAKPAPEAPIPAGAEEPRSPPPVPGQELSYMERFKGTEFGIKASQPPEPVAPQVSRTSAVITTAIVMSRALALALLLITLALVETGLVNIHFITVEPVRPPARYPPEIAAYGLAISLFSNFVAGFISGLVPGRIARGPWKGIVIGFLGLALVGNTASVIHFDLLSEGIVSLRGIAEWMSWNVLGAAVVRLVLLPVFPPR